MNGIIWMLQDDPDAFEPVFGTRTQRKREYIDGKMWAYGYMCGIELCRKQWQSFFDDPNGIAALRPIHLLGSDDVTLEGESLTDIPKQREELSKQIPASVAQIYRYWLPYRQAVYEQNVANTIQRSHPKIGRNDPCPCGSGLKFKKCCGVAASLHQLINESLNNLTPADVFNGLGQSILDEREKIKCRTLAMRRQLYYDNQAKSSNIMS